MLEDGNQRAQVKDEQECHPQSEGPAPVIDPLKIYVYSCYYAPRMAKGLNLEIVKILPVHIHGLYVKFQQLICLENLI